MEIIPSPEQPLSREIYLTPESIAIAALVDQLFRRVDRPGKKGEDDEPTDQSRL